MRKPVLGLYQVPEDNVSAYIRGKLERYEKGQHSRYRNINDLKRIVRKFVECYNR